MPTPRRKQFAEPDKTLGGLDAGDAAALIAATADVALVLDVEGIIRDVSFGSDELAREGYSKWLGHPWADTVTAASRPKVEAMLREAIANTASESRHVQHPSPRGVDVPVLYAAVRVGGKGRVVAVGRDLRAVAALQHRLVEAQQAIDHDRSHLRQMETRYRLLLRTVADAVLIVDAASEKVVEANPAAGELLGVPVARLEGRALVDCFDDRDKAGIVALLAAVRSSGRAEDVRVRPANGESEFVATAALFPQDKSTLILIRLSAPGAEAVGQALPETQASVLRLIDCAPDAFVATDLDGNVLTANAAFVEFAQLATAEQAHGRSLEQWLGRPGVDLDVLVANLRHHGTVRLFATTLRGEQGVTAEVEISAVAIPGGPQPCLGFTIRDVGRRLAADVYAGQPKSVRQLTELVGRVPLRDIVRDTTDLIEKLCIEAALELTRDNRASAAEMLGLSRQSLYVKLHRYGLGDLSPESDE